VLWRCLDCTTRYAASLAVCPHCGSTEREEDGMPKNTRHAGPSYEGHVDVSSPDTAAPEWVEAPYVDEPVTAPVEVVAEPADVQAEDAPKPARRRTRKG
jgi:hypothetical protein